MKILLLGPSSPEGFILSGDSTQAIQVTWQDFDSHIKPDVTEYEVKCKETVTGLLTKKDFVSVDSIWSYTFTNLSPGTLYTVSVTTLTEDPKVFSDETFDMRATGKIINSALVRKYWRLLFTFLLNNLVLIKSVRANTQKILIIFLHNTIIFIIFYLYIYPPDSQETDRGANT